MFVGAGGLGWDECYWADLRKRVQEMGRAVTPLYQPDHHDSRHRDGRAAL